MVMIGGGGLRFAGFSIWGNSHMAGICLASGGRRVSSTLEPLVASAYATLRLRFAGRFLGDVFAEEPARIAHQLNTGH